MSDHPAARASNNADAYRGLRTLALIAVAIGVILLAAAAFALSYAGIHAIALQAGVSTRLARLYPLIFDAMLVVGAAAVLSLRGAGLATRCYAWLSMLVLLAAAAGADALHATGTRLPHRSAAATVAIIPWALVLIGFGLLLAMLRHTRLRRVAAQAPQIAAHGQARAHWQASPGSAPAALPPGEMSAPAQRPAATPVPVQASVLVAPGLPVHAEGYAEADEDPIRYGRPYSRDVEAGPSADTGLFPGTGGSADAGLPAGAGISANTGLPADTGLPNADTGHPNDDTGLPNDDTGLAVDTGLPADTDLAVDAEAGQDDPTSDEASALGLSAAPWVPPAIQEANAGHGDEYPAGMMSAAPTPDPDDEADPAPPAVPHFDRMQSSPTPPTG
jgi:Protein of unknown function (DUF2637)